MQSIFGVLADENSKTLWACSNAFGPPGGAPPSPATLYAFDLNRGTTKGHYPFPTPGALCNDIVVDTDGTVYATDTNNMEVVRLRRGAVRLEVWAGHGAFGPRGGLVDGISILGRRVLVNTLVTSRIFSVPIEPDGAAGPVTEVKLDHPLAHPDGMRRFGDDSLLVAQGGEGGLLSRVVLHGDRATVTTIKEGFPDGPVAVTVVGTTAYVLEGQLGKLMHPPVPNGSDPIMKLNPFRATAVEVGRP
jgi:sugar lactone lactonase YvrE